jgi:hypothetical protein
MMRYRTVIGRIGAAAAIGLSVAIVAAGDTTFDAEAWRAGAGADPAAASLSSVNPRLEMAQSVMDDHLVSGMPRATVLELLGPPDLVQGTALHYVLGVNPYHIDPDGLVIVFDPDDRLREAYITQY